MFRSAALSQKAALQMPLAVTTPPVKMRLERSAERDKREIKNNFSADYAQSERGAHSKSSKIKGAGARLCICPFYNYTAP